MNEIHMKLPDYKERHGAPDTICWRKRVIKIKHGFYDHFSLNLGSTHLIMFVDCIINPQVGGWMDRWMYFKENNTKTFLSVPEASFCFPKLKLNHVPNYLHTFMHTSM